MFSPTQSCIQEIISNGVVKTMHHQTAFAHADDDFNLSISPSEFVEYAHNTLVRLKTAGLPYLV